MLTDDGVDRFMILLTHPLTHGVKAMFVGIMVGGLWLLIILLLSSARRTFVQKPK